MTAWLRSSVAWVDDGDRVVIVRLTTPLAPAKLLTESAAMIWRALDDNQPLSLASVTATVADEAGLDADKIVADVASFLLTLKSDGLAVELPMGSDE